MQLMSCETGVSAKPLHGNPVLLEQTFQLPLDIAVLELQHGTDLAQRHQAFGGLAIGDAVHDPVFAKSVSDNPDVGPSMDRSTARRRPKSAIA